MTSQTYRMDIQVDAGNAERSLGNLKRALGDVERTSAKTGDSLNNTSKRMGGLQGTVGRLKNAFMSLHGVLVTVGAAMGLGNIIRTADAMMVLNRQVQNATNSAQEYALASSEIKRIALDNMVSLDSVGGMYVSNQRALSQLGKTQQEVIGFTENVTLAMRAGGGSAASQAAALTQLGQAMASGVLRGDEFNSIAEQAPIIMELMSESLGVTTGELRKLAAEGKLTAETVYQALTSMSATDKLKSMTDGAITVAGAWQNVKTQFALLVDQFMNGEGAITATIASMVIGFADLVPKIGHAIQHVIDFTKFLLQTDQGVAVIDAIQTHYDALKSVIEDVSHALQIGVQYIQSNQEAFTALAAGLAAAYTAYKLIMIAKTVYALFATGAAVTTVLTAATGALATVMGVLTSPITAVVVAIGLLVAAGVYLYKNWDMVKQKAQEVFDSLPQPVKQAIDDIKQVFGGIAGFTIATFDSIAGFISKAFGAVVPIVDGYIKMMTLSWRMAFEVIKATVSFGIEAIKAVFVAGLNIVASLVSGTLRSISNIFTTVFAVIKALVRGDIDGVKTAISQGLQNAVAIVRQTAGSIVSAFKRLGSDLMQAGKDAIQGLINGIRSKISDAIGTVRDMAGSIASTVRSVLDIRSPSRVMAVLGEWTALGLAKGIADKTPVAAREARKMADQIKNNVASKLAELKREIALFGNNNPLAELAYDIGLGKYGRNTDQLTKLTQELYILKQTQGVVDDIRAINREIATHGMSRLEIFEWELENTDKYAGVLDDVLNQYRQILQTQAEFDKVIEQRNKIQQTNQSLVQKTADLHRQIALFGNDSALAAFEHDWAAGKYTEADVAIVTAYHQALIAIDELNRKANTKSAFDNLAKNLISEDPLQKLQSQLDERLKIISDYEQAHTDVAEQAAAARAQVQQSFDQARTDLMLATYENGLGAVNGIIKSAFGEQSGIYRAMFAIEKGYTLARVLLNQKEALAKAWASAPFPANLPAVATTAIKTGALSAAVQAINPVIGQAHDGIMSVPKSGTWNLEKGERVLPRHTAKALDDRLERMGGSNNVVNVNVTVNSDGTGDVQANMQQGKALGHAIKAAVLDVLRGEKRQGGALYGI